MSVYIVDASVAAKWFLNEVHSRSARRVLDAQNELHAPDFFLLEMDNVFCKRIRRGDISGDDGADARATLDQIPVTIHPSEKLRDVAYFMANRTNSSLYDCLYVALAAILDAKMVTADRRLHKRLADGPLAKHILWVEDL